MKVDPRRSDSAVAFARVGNNVTIFPEAKLVDRNEISLGSHIVIDDFVFISGRGGLTMGSFIHIASFVSITGGGPVELGDFSNLSTGVRVLSGSDDFGGQCLVGPTVPSELRRVSRAGVSIGSYSVIGANTVILPGVSIGEGVAVGAQSLVTRDLPPWTVCFGVPAAPVKERAQEAREIGEKLLEDS